MGPSCSTFSIAAIQAFLFSFVAVPACIKYGTINHCAADRESEAGNPYDRGVRYAPCPATIACNLCQLTSSSLLGGNHSAACSIDGCRSICRGNCAAKAASIFWLEALFDRIQGFLRTKGLRVWESFPERGQAEQKVMCPVRDVDSFEFLFPRCNAYPVR